MGSLAVPLSSIVNVSVFVAPQLPSTPTFNQGLIVGPSAVIPSVGANSRVRVYTGTAGMLADGFTVNSPEYLEASIYFGQTVPPPSVAIGRQDLTSLNTVVPHAASEGTGYLVGDVLTVVQGGGSGGTVKVTTVGGSGNITGVSIVTDGTGYTAATGLATTGGTGTGAQVDISAIGETPLTAVTACRAALSTWWGCVVTGAVTADHEALALYFQTVQPVGCYFYTTQDAAALNGTANNVFSFLKAAAYNRAFGIYSTTQSGVAPNNVYAAAAMMGVAMGLNTGLAGSAFTAWGKILVGITPEPLTATQISTIMGNNGNVYLLYQGGYQLSTFGVVANGQFLDEVLNLDLLVANIQFNVMNLLVSVPKVPQTDAGQTQLIHAVNQACQSAFALGFLGPGTWTGPTISFLPDNGLNYGDVLSSGYLALSPPYSQQSQANRQARKAQPIYVCIIEAGAVQSLVIGVYVQR